MADSEITTIRVQKTTVKKLKGIAVYGDTLEDVILRLVKQNKKSED